MNDTEEKKDGIDTADQTGDKNTTGEANVDNNSDNGSDSETKEKSFTQKQVNGMMAREKKQGREAAYREMGIDPNDTKMVSMFKAFIESQKTDEQKQTEIENEQNAKLAEAEERARTAEAKAEAMQLGILPQYVDDAITLALAKMSDDTDLKTIIGELKTKYPVWFNSTNGDAEDKAIGQKGTGSSIKAGSKDSDSSSKSLGSRLAAQRKANNGSGKKSFWS